MSTAKLNNNAAMEDKFDNIRTIGGVPAWSPHGSVNHVVGDEARKPESTLTLGGQP